MIEQEEEAKIRAKEEKENLKLEQQRIGNTLQVKLILGGTKF